MARDETKSLRVSFRSSDGNVEVEAGTTAERPPPAVYDRDPAREEFRVRVLEIDEIQPWPLAPRNGGRVSIFGDPNRSNQSILPHHRERELGAPASKPKPPGEPASGE